MNGGKAKIIWTDSFSLIRGKNMETPNNIKYLWGKCVTLVY